MLRALLPSQPSLLKVARSSTALMTRLMSSHTQAVSSASASDTLWSAASDHARKGNYDLFVSLYTQWKESKCGKPIGYWENSQHGLLASAHAHKKISDYLRRDGAHLQRTMHEIGYCVEDEALYQPEIPESNEQAAASSLPSPSKR
jgi:hypothetical protein